MTDHEHVVFSEHNAVLIERVTFPNPVHIANGESITAGGAIIKSPDARVIAAVVKSFAKRRAGLRAGSEED